MSGIIAITKGYGVSLSSWKMPPWIFTSIKFFPFAINSAFQFLLASVIFFFNSLDI